MKHLLLVLLFTTTGIYAQDSLEIGMPNIVDSEVLYIMNGEANCGYAVSKGYHYKSVPHIYVVEEGDTIRFYNEKTKRKWIKKGPGVAKKQADKFWKTWHPEK